ncbi:hypothetical protein ACE1YR_19160 [Pseudomonas sp. K1(2024)]|uniref:Uncharacterized protein n=1 Tax=Pseudomonas boreofloridensis TaxID=3064348 RepID=A0ABV4ZDE5_9PSED|nr:hypothetical protein [Pseudomonas sp. K13]MDO7901430.1 hypothetical protein [Pseudomonas sp. K13]
MTEKKHGSLHASDPLAISSCARSARRCAWHMRVCCRIDFDQLAQFQVYRSEQPCIPAKGSDSGYVSVTLEPRQMTTRFQVISERRDPAATISTLRRFVVEDGRAGAQPG